MIAAEPLDSRLEQDGRGGSIHVVVAVDQDRFLGGDGLLNARDGAIHAEHRVWIEQVLDTRIQKMLGFGGGANAAGQQQLGEEGWNVRLAGQRLGLIDTRRAQNPALRRARSRGRNDPIGSGRFGTAHGSSSSSSSSKTISPRPSTESRRL